MKKAFGKGVVFVVMLLFIYSMFPISAEKVTVYDSLVFSEEEKETYAQSSECTVIKLYDIVMPFNHYDEEKDAWNIRSVVLSRNFYWYLSISPNGELTYTYTNHSTRYANISDWSDSYHYALDPHVIFGEDIVIYNVYCISSERKEPNAIPSYGGYKSGIYVYYVTDRGDFVLHKPRSEKSDIYLMPYEAFCGYMKAVYDYWRVPEHLIYGEGLHVRVEGVFDLEPYRLENFKLPYEEPPADGGDTGTTPEENGNGGAQLSEPPAEAHPWKDALIYASVGVVAFVCGCGGTVAIVFYRKHRGKKV